jgi:uncharacterized protein
VRCFVDTSALLAVLDRSDRMHAEAARTWGRLLGDDSNRMVTTNYVLVETAALVQSRLGLSALRTFSVDVSPVLTTVWVDPELHEKGLSGVLSQSRRRLSLVDCVSFEAMRKLGIRHCFAFDPHFGEQGFREFRPRDSK